MTVWFIQTIDKGCKLRPLELTAIIKPFTDKIAAIKVAKNMNLDKDIYVSGFKENEEGSFIRVETEQVK